MGSAFKRVTASEPGKFDLGWCRWANQKRLICGIYGNIRGKKYAEPPYTRLFAVDADGAALKVLEQARNEGNLFVTTTSMRNFNMNYGASIEKSTASELGVRDADTISKDAQNTFAVSSFSPERQDEVIDFTPDDPDTVLIQFDEDHDSFPSIVELNLNTASRFERIGENPPIRQFVTDGRGNPRIGWGSADGLNTIYFARLDGEREWRRLGATQAFSTTNRLRPIAMATEVNTAYALGTYEGRDALWSIDLADKREPNCCSSHPLVDVGEPVFQTDRSLLGVRYDVERPYVWYADPKLRELIDRLDKQFPNRVHDIIDSSDDKKALLIQASSPIDLGTYYVYDAEKEKLQKLGTAYPELDQNALGWTTNIVYKAADGTEIPGYLSVPSGAERKNLPLIVIAPRRAAGARFLEVPFPAQLLVNRGYAVLQMNYRGSDGLGQKWRLDGHQQWGGLIYSDIQDATRWAVSEGIADPKRICIMGWGFGGYEALLSAARNGDLYRCAVSIAGIADLATFQEQGAVTGQQQFRRAQIGTDREKLKRDSPAENAAQISVPVLLVHGTKDWQVQVDQTNAMESALDKHKKTYEVVIIKGGSHELERKSDRVTLLRAIDAFLAQHMGSGPGS